MAPTPQQLASAGVYFNDGSVDATDGSMLRASLGLLPDGTYGLGLYDQYAQTLLTPSGFGPSWAALIQSGILNNMFQMATPGALVLGTSRDDPAGISANLPYWTAWQSTPGASAATAFANPAWPGGNYVNFGFSAVGTSSSNNVAMTSALLPVLPGCQYRLDTIQQTNIPAGVTLNRMNSILFYDSTGAYISRYDLTTSWTSSLPLQVNGGGMTVAPMNACYARVEINVWETVLHSASTQFTVGAFILTPGFDGYGDYLYGVGSGDTSGSQFNGVRFGNPTDTYLFRTAAGALATTGSLAVRGQGYVRYAWPPAYSPAGTYATTLTLPINGGAVWTDILMPTGFDLYDLYLRCPDTSGAHTAEWSLYALAGMSDTGTQVAAGTFSFTPTSAGSWQSLSGGGQGQDLPFGNYRLVIRNTSASVAFGISTSVAAGVGGTFSARQTLGSPLPASLDTYTGWTKQLNILCLEMRTNDS
jgi:hypothetical protein